MAKRHHFRRAHAYRRRRKLNATIWGPIIKLLAVIVALLGTAALILYVFLPWALPKLGVDYRAPFAPSATPAPTPRPTPSPHPMEYYDAVANAQEVVFSTASSCRWYSDPYFYNGKMILTGGVLEGSDVNMSGMYFYDPDTRTEEKIALAPQNTHFMFPKFNDRWLVYLDANRNGGGTLMACDLTAQRLTPVELKVIYTGQPEPMLSGDYVAFTDRTGTNRDKLFVCDLNTHETTVVQMFTSSVYGQSKPSLSGDLLAWADLASGAASADANSEINYIRIGESTVNTTPVGTFVHDPESNGLYTAWLTDVHSGSTQLYAMKGLTGTPFLIDSGVVEFGLCDNFIAYSREEKIYVYLFATGKTYRINADYEAAQFLSASDNTVAWMDVTSRERDIVKFLRIPG